jgi:hypothetical protein
MTRLKQIYALLLADTTVNGRNQIDPQVIAIIAALLYAAERITGTVTPP